MLHQNNKKIYAKTFCKPALIKYHKKKKNFELVATHISHDIIPKILPQYDFHLPLDEMSLSSEQVKASEESIHKLSRDFRLKATKLYLQIAKAEFDFQQERLDKLLGDFPQDREKEDEQLAQTVNANANTDTEPTDDENDDVFTQRPQRNQVRSVKENGSEMYTKYIEMSLKRALLEIEREVLFLVEHSVKETPFVIQEAQELNPVLRKDFVLLA